MTGTFFHVAGESAAARLKVAHALDQESVTLKRVPGRA
jgi:hypothetical protein